MRVNNMVIIIIIAIVSVLVKRKYNLDLRNAWIEIEW